MVVYIANDFNLRSYLYWKVITLREPDNGGAHWVLGSTLEDMGFPKLAEKEYALYWRVRSRQKDRKQPKSDSPSNQSRYHSSSRGSLPT
jgi:hypothetical protein